jgi:Tol biopolymer transport system component
VRAVLAILGVCLLAGCGARGQHARSGGATRDPGVLVTGGVIEPVPRPPPGQNTPWHAPISYYALRPDGTVARKLPGFSYLDFDVDFSADGKLAVMSSADGIVVSHADGSDRRAVPLPADPIADAPALSPDGKTVALAYAPDAESVDFSTNLWTVSVDGSDLRRLTTTGDVLSSSWSPDGKRIAFTDGSQLENSSSGAVADLYVVDGDGSNLHRVGRSFTGLGREVEWSPDGSRIAFEDAEQRIVISDPEGGSPEVVAGEGESPAWSPDGKRIAFLRIKECGRYVACVRSRIFVADLATGKEHAVGPKFGEPVSLSWIPEGAPSAKGTSTAPRQTS